MKRFNFLFLNQVPNIVGALLGFAQVSLFAKFSTLSLSTRSKLKSDDPLSM